ncbi:MAG: FkbM family methyltransferase [Rhodomicrobium sp.]
MFRTFQKFMELRQYKTYSRDALHPIFSIPELVSEGYFSQYGQDKWIAEVLFPGKRNGVFVDIGAHDGVSFSNSYFLENNLGWTGIAVEPIPRAIQKLCAIRRCEVVQGCVAGQSGKRRFTIIPGEDMRSRLTSRWLGLGRSSPERVEIEVECFSDATADAIARGEPHWAIEGACRVSTSMIGIIIML